jgi:hypothetical protein
VKTSTGFFLSSPEYPREFYPATFTPDLSRPPHKVAKTLKRQDQVIMAGALDGFIYRVTGVAEVLRS